MRSGIGTIIEPSIIEDVKSYWAMHFCSILEVLYEHKNLEFTFRKSIPLGTPQTLASFRGICELGFFNRMRESVRNWGLQYFLCHYLASKEGYEIFAKLVESISNNYNFNLLENYHSYGVFVCGIDSHSGSEFIIQNNAAAFGYNEKTIINFHRDIKYVDLCILIKRFQGDVQNTALLGEVEGNHGQKLLRNAYWDRKSSVCNFGIGVQKNAGKISLHNVPYGSGIKTIIIMGSENSVIDDFQTAIGIMESFLLNSPQKIFQKAPGQNEVLEIIKSNWTTPVIELIQILRSFVTREETAILGINPTTIQSIPKIVI